MTKAYVALGANLGHPQEALQAALEDLRQTAGVDVTAGGIVGARLCERRCRSRDDA